MTLMEFFGCSFIAFGPPLALLIFTIAKDPLRIIVLMASCFFWLIALLLSSLLWYAVVPLRDKLAFGLVFSVLFQELFRFLFYILLRKADEGLMKVSQQSGQTQIVNNKHLMAYVSGLGFGVINGAFSLVNVLADSSGPGTIGLKGDSDMFFVVSALLTLSFIFAHTFWGVIFHYGLDQKNYFLVILVVCSHMTISCLSLINQGAGTSSMLYLASVIPAYVNMIVMGIMAFFVAGGSLKSLKACCLNQRGGFTFQ